MKGLQSGELTMIGQRQHFLLGREMAKKYGNFLGSKLAYDEFYVRSSGYQRTVTSAISHLMGMWEHFDPTQLNFPDNDVRVLPPGVTMATTTAFRTPLPKGYLPDAIHTEEEEQELMLAALQSKICPKLNQVSSDMSKQITTEMDAKPEFRTKVQAAADRYGMTIKSSKSFTDACREIADFAIQDVRNNPDPKIKESEDLYKFLQRCAEGHMMIRYTDPKITKGVVSNLIVDLTDKLLAKANNTEIPLKYQLYSGHDITILPLLALVGGVDSACYIKDFKGSTFTQVID